MKVTADSPVVADAHALYLAFGGCQHRKIEAAMHAKGYEKFSRRVFHDRRDGEKVTIGWIRRFGWKDPHESPKEFKQDRQDIKRKSYAVERTIPYPALCTSLSADKRDPENNDHPAYPVHPVNKPKPNEIRALRKWLQRVSPRMNWTWPHLRYLYRKLADVTNGKTKRLMIFMPPRHGKSELVTVHYPAYRLKKNPWLNIIVASYNQKLANRFSRKIRTTWENSQPRKAAVPNKSKQDIQDELDIEKKNDPVDPVHPVDSSSQRLGDSAVSVPPAVAGGVSQNASQRRLNTAAEWETGMGGGVRAVGVGAGITGYGGKLIIIDDPIKSRSEAESETYRNKTWEWFNDDLYTRLEPDAAMILIQTRWHEDDLAGRLLEEMKNGGEKWEVVSLPAIAESEPPTGVPAAASASGVAKLAGGLTSDEFKQDRQDEQDMVGKSSPPYEGGVAAASADGVVLSPDCQTSTANSDPNETEYELHPISNSFIEIRTPLPKVETPPRRWDAIGRHPGDALCPEHFPLRELERIRRQLGEYSFSALYQQRPMPLEGGLFKKKWFTRIVDRAPAGLRWVRGYDLAISLKTSADFTASARVALDTNGDLYISDVFRARVEYPDQRKFIVDRLINERDTHHCIEDAIHAKAIIHDLRRDPRLARCAVKLVRVTNDKFTRALAWANRAEEGKVVLVRGPWLNMFLDEVCSFPNSAHDDMVDAVSLAVRSIDRPRRQLWRF